MTPFQARLIFRIVLFLAVAAIAILMGTVPPEAAFALGVGFGWLVVPSWIRGVERA